MKPPNPTKPNQTKAKQNKTKATPHRRQSTNNCYYSSQLCSHLNSLIVNSTRLSSSRPLLLQLARRLTNQVTDQPPCGHRVHCIGAPLFCAKWSAFNSCGVIAILVIVHIDRVPSNSDPDLTQPPTRSHQLTWPHLARCRRLPGKLTTQLGRRDCIYLAKR